MATNAETRFYLHASTGREKYGSVDVYYRLKVSGRSIQELLIELNRHYTEREIAEKLGYSRGYIAAVKQGRRAVSMQSKTYNAFMTKIKNVYPGVVYSEYAGEDFKRWVDNAMDQGVGAGLSKVMTADLRNWNIRSAEGTYESGLKFTNHRGTKYIAVHRGRPHSGEFRRTRLDNFPAFRS